jgi:RNA polymerase sigma factor (sigma-70 family)
VSHFILSNSGSEADAQDTFQEAVLVFYEKVKEEGFSLSCKAGTYLYSVSRHLWLKKIRKASLLVGKISDPDQYIDIPDDPADAMKEAGLQKMESALALLGEPCKSLIEDFYLNNLSMNQITEKFGYTNADNAKTQKYKCMVRLKKLFFRAGETEEEGKYVG